MNNPFFDPADYEFEVLGFFEEFIDVERHRSLGTRPVTVLDRPLGSDGMQERQLTETVQLTKGLRQVTVKASKQKPIKIWSLYQVLCGKQKPTPPTPTAAEVEALRQAYEQANTLWETTAPTDAALVERRCLKNRLWARYERALNAHTRKQIAKPSVYP